MNCVKLKIVLYVVSMCLMEASPLLTAFKPGKFARERYERSRFRLQTGKSYNLVTDSPPVLDFVSWNRAFLMYKFIIQSGMNFIYIFYLIWWKTVMFLIKSDPGLASNQSYINSNFLSVNVILYVSCKYISLFWQFLSLNVRIMKFNYYWSSLL